MRTLPDPGFAGDDGSDDPEVRQALQAYDQACRAAHEGADGEQAALHSAALMVLQHSRLLVPVVAVATETEVDARGLTSDKSTDMATVLVTGQDGRRGLLAFTGTEAMARFDPAARPVPVDLVTAARAALDDGADALVVDLAGPVLFAVEAQDLAELAAGRRLIGTDQGPAWLGAPA